MKIRIKSWFWNLTIFAGQWNNTALGNTIYVQKDFYSLSPLIRAKIIFHEEVHLKQQAENEILKFVFLYLFCLPILYNPYRYKWETEAYQKEGWFNSEIRLELRSWRYGWLRI